MHNKARTRPVRAMLCGVSLALLAGCTTATITGTAVPRSSPLNTAPQISAEHPGQPSGSVGSAVTGEQQALAAAFIAARAVDPCALHDPAVAATVAGMPGDEIMPGRILNSCDLDLSRSAQALSAWRLTTTVGVLFDDQDRQEATRETIGELTVYRRAELDDRGDSCTYVMAFGGEHTGIELRVRRDDDKGNAKNPCQIAQDYLRGVGKYWTHPAQRTDKLTTPALTIGAADPCAALGTVSSKAGGAVRVSMTEPHSCRLTTGTPSNGEMITGEYGIETDPRALLTGASAKDYKSVTVANRPGVAQERTSILKGASKTCSITVVVDEQIVLQADQAKADSPKSLQVVKTSANDCAVATTAAEALLAAIH